MFAIPIGSMPCAVWTLHCRVVWRWGLQENLLLCVEIFVALHGFDEASSA